METKTIICPFSKTEVVLKAWITSEEKEVIERPFKDYKMAIDQGKFERVEINIADVSKKSKKIAVESVVVSIDGSSENIYDRIMKMRMEDGQSILNCVDKIVSGENFTQSAPTQGDGIDAAN